MFSRGFETSQDDEDDEDTNNDESSEDVREILTPVRRGKAVERKPDRGKQISTVDERKPLTVDEKGRPYGGLTSAFEEELRLMTRDLDPCCNMRDQTPLMRERFFKRLLEGTKIWFGTKTLNSKYKMKTDKMLFYIYWCL